MLNATPARAQRQSRPIWVRGATLVDPVAGEEGGTKADILVRDGQIAAIGEGAAAVRAPDDAEIFEASSLIAIPGLVNAHYHSHDALLKGAFDVMSLERWAVRALPRYFPPRSDRELRLRTLIGAAECLRGGISTVQDMLSLWPLTSRQAAIVRDTYRETGLRVVLGLQLADTGPLDTIPYLRDILPADLAGIVAGPPPPPDMPAPVAELEHILAELPAEPNDRVTWAVCPSSPERCSQALLARLLEIARAHSVRLFSHVAISRVEAVGARMLFEAHGGSPIRYLDSIGALGPDLTLAHGVWLDDDDARLLADSGTRLVMNPMSNLKTRNGIAPYRRYAESGIRPGLGCDNCSCSDAQNMFQAMKFSVLLAGIAGRSDDGPGARDSLRAATADGAHALGLDTTGRLSPGFKADITFLDRDDPVYRPLNDATRQIVYGEAGRGVSAVMVDGRFVVRDRKLLTIDEDALADELAELMPAVLREAEAVRARAERLDPYLAEAEARSWEVDVGMTRMACE
jgi:cytosine/adenosine deaminase-related metal-dependent hydrolase